MMKYLNHNSCNGKVTDDEFYTRRADVDAFLDAVNLSGLRIYCPCDTQDSAFVRYMTDHDLDFFAGTDMWDVTKYNECDIVITNPPFHGYNAYLSFLRSIKKPFILIFPTIGALARRTKGFATQFFMWGDVDTFLGPDGQVRKSLCRWITSFHDPRHPCFEVDCTVTERQKKKFDAKLHI